MVDVSATSQSGSPFGVELFDGQFRRAGWLNDAELDITVRHNARGIATINLPANHVRAPALMTPGARVVISYTPTGLADPMFLVSGRVRTRAASGPIRASMVSATVHDDWRYLEHTLAWPAPAAALTAQTPAYYTDSGPAEDVIKRLIAANLVTRLGRPVTVPASQGRGASVKASARFVTVADEVARLAKAGGIGIRLKQIQGGLAVDCYTPTDRRARPLSESAGTVLDWSSSSTDPDATRVILGAAGEATARTFRRVIDSARESSQADVIEVFSDARDLDLAADIDQRGNEALAEAEATQAFSATLAETPTMSFGRSLFLGDLARVETLPGLFYEDSVNEVNLSWSAGEGLTVTPVVGDPDKSDPTRVQASAIRALATALKRLEAST